MILSKISLFLFIYIMLGKDGSCASVLYRTKIRKKIYFLKMYFLCFVFHVNSKFHQIAFKKTEICRCNLAKFKVLRNNVANYYRQLVFAFLEE